MDPLSIAVGAASLALAAAKVSGYIITYVTKKNTVDENVTALHIEIKSLTTVLKAMEAKFSDNAVVEATLANETGHEAQLWRSVGTSLKDCGTTLKTLEEIWSNVNQTEPRIFGRSRKLLSLTLNMERITILRSQVASYRQTMQLSINLLILYDPLFIFFVRGSPGIVQRRWRTNHSMELRTNGLILWRKKCDYFAKHSALANTKLLAPNAAM